MREKYRSIHYLSFVLLVGAVICLVLGSMTTYEVGQKRRGRRFKKFRPETISELELLVDTTFSGVTKKEDGRLYSVWDRTVGLKKKLKCPT